MREEMLPELEPLHTEDGAVTRREFVLARRSLSYHPIDGIVNQTERKREKESLLIIPALFRNPCNALQPLVDLPCLGPSAPGSRRSWYPILPKSVLRWLTWIYRLHSTRLLNDKWLNRSNEMLTVLLAISWWGSSSIPLLCCVGVARMWRA
jgi:hypothetical protein